MNSHPCRDIHAGSILSYKTRVYCENMQVNSKIAILSSHRLKYKNWVYLNYNLLMKNKIPEFYTNFLISSLFPKMGYIYLQFLIVISL